MAGIVGWDVLTAGAIVWTRIRVALTFRSAGCDRVTRPADLKVGAAKIRRTIRECL